MSLTDMKGKTNDKSKMLRNYATTAHKSQGSEVQTVVFLVEPWECPRLHYRNLFYTAMTRAKAKCIVIGPDDVFQKMIHREPIKRLTSVREHF
jgi:exodeoxyribonuclease V alpha subunit